MEKTFNPNAIERALYQRWENSGHFQPSGDENAAPYCILLPPPNVTGSLHMGHAFQQTIMDALIRYHRMQGDNTLWQAGTDHAGIATQMVVERQLNAQGLTRHDLGRESFLERVWQWKEESGGTITGQMRRLGTSPDWSREAFTMDDDLSAAVQEVFVQLFDEDLIYRGQRLVNWDPVLHTAVSDLEVVSEEEDGFLWHFAYPLADGSGQLVVATTRPETMLGDTAVAVHPEDERYAHLIGKLIKLPLTDREIPIVADDYVEREFGTGCVKITPAHDFNDYELGKRHNLPMINIFTKDAAINENAPQKYQGLDRYEARKVILADLEALGVLVETKAHKLMVPRGDRTNAVIEPYLTDQWFVKIEPLAKPAIEAVENGDIKFIPENWTKTYFQWMYNIQDWCISRQLWWGHRIPAWYDNNGGVYVARSEAEVRSKYNLGADVELHQDNDVLDTWFSSALWPFATMGWPENTKELNTFVPSAVLVTGFDIIFFWVARMIMMTLKFTGKVPFKEVYVTGLIRDEHGQKMSKSKGNVIDPLDMIDGIELETLVAKRTKGMMQPQLAAKIEKQTRKEFADGIEAHGTDALRFTLAALASTGRDINWDMGRLEGYRNFTNKIWNASRYVLMNTEGEDCGFNGGELEFSLADRWIDSLLQQCISEYRGHIDNYRFDLAASTLYEFTWNQFCDWYLELTKPVLFKGTEAQKRGTRHSLLRTLETLLRLMHPLMPYITETIWQSVAPLTGNNDEFLMTQQFPIADDSHVDQAALADTEWLKRFIIGVRNIRGEMNIAPSKPLTVLVKNADNSVQQRLSAYSALLQNLAKLEKIELLAEGSEEPLSASSYLGDATLLIPMAGLIDVAAELARLQKALEKAQQEQSRVAGKLSNEAFVGKAPEAVIIKEREKLAELDAALANLNEQIAKLQTLA